MFGTVAIIKPSPGRETAIADKLNEWWETRRTQAEGALSSTVHRNGQELILSVVFDNEEHYRANAEDPAQDRWYQEVRALMEEDPRWMDGEVLAFKHA
jgi:quinol monooxygenase YgiN